MGPRRGPGEVSGARACVQIRPQADFTWKDVASPSEGLLLKMKRYCLLGWMVCRVGAYSSFNCISHMRLLLIPVASMCAECDENKQP